MDKEVIDKVFGEKVGSMVDEIVPPIQYDNKTMLKSITMLS